MRPNPRFSKSRWRGRLLMMTKPRHRSPLYGSATIQAQSPSLSTNFSISRWNDKVTRASPPSSFSYTMWQRKSTPKSSSCSSKRKSFKQDRQPPSLRPWVMRCGRPSAQSYSLSSNCSRSCLVRVALRIFLKPRSTSIWFSLNWCLYKPSLTTFSIYERSKMVLFRCKNKSLILTRRCSWSVTFSHLKLKQRTLKSSGT